MVNFDTHNFRNSIEIREIDLRGKPQGFDRNSKAYLTCSGEIKFCRECLTFYLETEKFLEAQGYLQFKKGVARL